MTMLRTLSVALLLAIPAAAQADAFDCLPKPLGSGVEFYATTIETGHAISWLCPDIWEWRLQRVVWLKSSNVDQDKIKAALASSTTPLTTANALLAGGTDCKVATGDLAGLCAVAAANGPMYPAKYVTTVDGRIWAYAGGAVNFAKPMTADPVLPAGSRCGCGMFRQTITRLVPGGGPAGLYCAIGPGAAARCVPVAQ